MSEWNKSIYTNPVSLGRYKDSKESLRKLSCRISYKQLSVLSRTNRIPYTTSWAKRQERVPEGRKNVRSKGWRGVLSETRASAHAQLPHPLTQSSHIYSHAVEAVTFQHELERGLTGLQPSYWQLMAAGEGRVWPVLGGPSSHRRPSHTSSTNWTPWVKKEEV